MANDRLNIELDASTSKLERAFAKASSVAETHAKKMGSAFSAANSSLAAIGVTLSVGAFAGMVKGVAQSGDELQKLSIKTGETVENLSKLQYAASLSDLSNEDLAAGLIKLNKVMGQAADGSKEASEALARFGISPSTSMSVTEAMTQIAERVKNTGDETRVASALNDVFGRSFSTLIPLLKGGAGGLKDAGDELERMGGVMSGDLAKASEAFNDNLTKIGKSLDALKIESMSGVVAGLETLTSKFTEATKAAGGFWAGLATWATTSGKQEDDPSAAIVNITKKLKVLQEQKAGLEAPGLVSRLGLNSEDLAIVNKQISMMTTQSKYLQLLHIKNTGAASVTDGWMVKTIPGDPIAEKKDKPSTGRAKRETAYSDPLAANAEAYGKAIERIVAAQADAEKSAVSLNGAEQALHDLMASAAWRDMPQAWKEVVEAQAAASSEAIKAAESQKLLNNLLAATPTGKLVEQQKAMGLLVEAFDAGKISAVQFDEAAEAVYGTVTEGAQEATDAMDAFADQAARNMQDAFADFLFDPFKDGVDDMALNFAKALQRMLANAAAAKLSEALFGETGSGGGLGGFLGSLFGSGGASSAAAAMESGGSIYATAMTTLANAKGGVYSSPGLSAYSGQIVSKPTVFPFAKGAGLMGEAGPEAILPLSRDSKGRLGVTAQSGGSNVAINITVNEGQGADKTESSGDTKGAWTQFSGRIRALVLEEMDRQKMPGGRLYA